MRPRVPVADDITARLALPHIVQSPSVGLLWAGQFGTRLQGGKDAASARYIFTRLEPITRVLFNEADDKLLAYLNEEGQSIEPQWCAPSASMTP